MKTQRQTSKSIRVLVQDIENSKPVASKSFTVYETSLGEVFKVVNRAISDASEKPAPKRRARKAKEQDAAPSSQEDSTEATPAS